MSLSYDWYPSGTDMRYVRDRNDRNTLKVGDLVAYEHAVWWVHGIRERHAADVTDERKWVVVLRPINVDRDQTAHSRDRHLVPSRYYDWRVFEDPKHYPVCACCHEPVPCRAVMAIRVAEASIKEAARYEQPGVCPSCEKPITLRQRSVTFPTLTPTGPIVTFHLRAKCHYLAVKYEKRVRRMYPDWRTSLSCEGYVTRHGDSTFDCTQMAECPGPTAVHVGYGVCRCDDCHRGGSFGCHPAPSDQRRSA